MMELIQPALNGAFVRDGFGCAPGDVRQTSGALSGLRLAVKDTFEVAQQTAASGNPQWGATQAAALRTAPAVRRLLDAGACWVGKTVTDELTYSLAGINVHYGTPVNPAAHDRLPGGSSSGSAVAVAAGLADIALGTDCGGSIRLPASYCGLWGIRPTHGRVIAEGCFTLAQSFDTVGWLTYSGEQLGQVLEQMLYTRLPDSAPSTRWLVSDDLIAQLDAQVADAFERWLAASGLDVQRLPAGALALEAWAAAFRTLQAAEIAQLHGAWVEREQPLMGSDVAARFRQASAVSASAVAQAQRVRIQAQARLSDLLGSDAALITPPVPGPAPYLTADSTEVDDTRTRSQRLLCPAGLAGLPQVTFPWARVDQAPVGLSVIAPRFADEHAVVAALALSGRPRPA